MQRRIPDRRGSRADAALLAACVALCVCPAATFGQGDDPVLEEIVVTARLREQPLQDVPVSIVAFDSSRIDEFGSYELGDLQSQIPNFVTSETALGSNISIRGIFSGANQGFEQSVGTYVDRVYRGRSQQTRAPFVDLERVEVLRGSQNILFGHNSVAGALNLISAKPTREFVGSVGLLLEPELNQRDVTAVVSGPLGEDVAGRFAVRDRRSDGQLRNLTLGRDEPRRDDVVVRGTITWEPSNRLTVTTKLELSDFDVRGRNIEVISDLPAQAGPFAGLNYSQILVALGQDPGVLDVSLNDARSSNGDYSENETTEALLSIEYQLGALTLTSVTAYSAYEFDELCDCDFTGADVFSVPQSEEYDQYSQEIRIASEPGGDLDFIAGIYYQTADLHFFDTLKIDDASVLVPIVNALTQSASGFFLANTATPRYFDQDASTWSAFGQVTRRLNDRTRFTAGLRVSREVKEASRRLDITDIDYLPLEEPAATVTPLLYAGLFNVRPHDLNDERTETLSMPSIGLQRDFGADSMAYVTLTRGAKSGGFDPRSNNPISAGGGFEFEDESALNFEAGIKQRLAGGNAEINVAYYRTDIEDMQVSTYDGTLGYNVTNAGEALTQGIELDARWAVSRDLMLGASMALTDFEFEDYTGECYFSQIPDSPDGINCNYAGKTNQFVPDYFLRLRADYLRPLTQNLVLRALFDVTVSDDFFRTPTLDPRQVQSSFTTLDARLAIGELDGKWEIALIGRNLTDEDIIRYSIDVPLAGANFGTPSIWGFVEQPRTVALQGSYRF